MELQPVASRALGDNKEDLMFVGHDKGYSLNILIEPLSNIAKKITLCSQCKGLLRNPTQVGSVTGKKYHICKLCSKDFRSGIELEVVSEGITELDVKCPLHERGCRWKGILGAVGHHLDVCEEIKLCCPKHGCRQVVQRKHLEHHIENECMMRPIKCEHCNALHCFQDTEKHANECQEYPVVCACGEIKKRKYILAHKQNECLETIVECDFKIYGCTDRFKRRNHKTHNEENDRKHDKLKIAHLENKINAIDDYNKKQQERIRELEELSTYSLVLDLNMKTIKLKDNKYHDGEKFQIPGCDIKFYAKYGMDQEGNLNLAVSVWPVSGNEAFSRRFWTILVDQSGNLCKQPAGKFKTGAGIGKVQTDLVESRKVIAKIPLGNLEAGLYNNNVVNVKIYSRKN